MAKGKREGKHSQIKATAPRRATSHPVLSWLRVSGFGSLTIGLGSLFLTDHFWFAVAAIYASLALWAADAWLEPTLLPHPLWRAAIVTTLVFIGAAFAWSFVVPATPISISAIATDGTFPAGATEYGISWRPEFTELQIAITNNSSYRYDDLTLLLKPPMPIAAIQQITNVGGVTFELPDLRTPSESAVEVDLQTGKRTVIPLELLATDAGYRVRCRELSPGDTINIEFALAAIKPAPPILYPSLATSYRQQASDPSYWLKVSVGKSSYWFGHRDGTAYASRSKIRSSMIAADGTYTALFRKRDVDTRIPIAGLFDVKIEMPR